MACSLATTDEFDYEYIGGIWKKNSTADEESNHIVEITGWGVTRDGTKFWQARNSWGTYWGERGFFKVSRIRKGLFPLRFSAGKRYCRWNCSSSCLAYRG